MTDAKIATPSTRPDSGAGSYLPYAGAQGKIVSSTGIQEWLDERREAWPEQVKLIEEYIHHLRTTRDIADGERDDAMLSEIATGERLEAAEQERHELRNVRDGANTAEGLWHAALKQEREKYNVLLDEMAGMRRVVEAAGWWHDAATEAGK